MGDPSSNVSALASAFTADRYQQCLRVYDKWTRALDENLYQLCRTYPDHRDHAGVAAKCWTIGRTYATGIERQITSDGQQGDAVGKLVHALTAQGHTVDSLINELSEIESPLTVESLATVLRVHGRFLQLLRHVVRANETPRSFASKYLHFHCPLVPIYDSVAADELRRLVRWRSDLIVFPTPEVAEEEYAWFCYRLWHLHGHARSALGGCVSVKMLDYYLLCLADRSI